LLNPAYGVKNQTNWTRVQSPSRVLVGISPHSASYSLCTKIVEIGLNHILRGLLLTERLFDSEDQQPPTACQPEMKQKINDLCTTLIFLRLSRSGSASLSHHSCHSAAGQIHWRAQKCRCMRPLRASYHALPRPLAAWPFLFPFALGLPFALPFALVFPFV